MTNLPLRHILTLVCVEEMGNFRRAAERLGLSQPAVSAHIRDLEAHFGVPLVHRTTRQVALTTEGAGLVARARRAFQELETASQDLRDLASAHRGYVVVACIPPMMVSIVPNVVRRLAEEFPAVKVEIRDVLSNQVEKLVERGDADFGIGPQPNLTELSFNRLLRDYFVAVMPNNHVLAGCDPIDLENVIQHPWITMTSDANARKIVDQVILRLRRPTKPRFELVHIFSVGQLVKVGLGLAILPRMAIPSLGPERLKIADIRKPRIYRDIGVMYRPKYRLSPAARAFMTVLDKVLKEETSARSTP